MEQNEDHNISEVVIHLLKGVLYKEDKPKLWESLESQQTHIRDYLAVIGLDVEIMESDGFAYIRSREYDDSGNANPRLVARRPLSYPVSLILAIMRRKLAEHDALSSEARLIMETRDLYDSVSAFIPLSNNEVKVLKRFESHLQRIQDLGFIRFLNKDKTQFEVKRVIKAFVDAQWLNDFDKKLAAYASQSNLVFEETENA
ncbi:DUF4194 domain-containing protein [uncultured Sphaerochaeta sp.]|uniref:DUF4194 domain-containing protein n=1 Tax=uncultured Sphaerochaeta sp. TaxID=886478 RepID=UPI002A0A2D14|nr:DUF4194 domain-containing protein [uncultured Sphaerochaeta sp.]